MRLLPSFALVALSVSLASPAIAQDNLHIQNAIWGRDMQTIQVTLSESVSQGYIKFTRQGHGQGDDYSSFVSFISASTDSVLLNVGSMFPESTSGDQLVTLQPCRGELGATTSVCGPVYTDTVTWGGPTSFSDVSDSNPYAAAIHFVQERGIVTGYADGTFKPNEPIVRAEFTKMIAFDTFGIESINTCTTAPSFSDVPATIWYAPSLCKAQRAGLIAGYPDGTFHPGNQINVAEAAKIIVEAQLSTHPESSFPAESNPWYQRYVDYLVAQNALPRSIVHMDSRLTRGEMAEILYRLEGDNIQPVAEGTYRLGTLPTTKLVNMATNIVYAYSLTAPADQPLTLTQESFAVSGTRWTNPELRICSEAACSFGINSWQSTDNWTGGTTASFVGRLVIPAGQTKYFELAVSIDSNADMGISLTASHEGLGAQTISDR